MADGEYWSIGEVLSLLQDEFPEITISKIRFLESQGLIQPERTPSGYRRFYQMDFDLLQWILVQQRDHYLPLKVIRDRIKSGDTEQGLLDFSGQNGELPPMPVSHEADSVHASGSEDSGEGTDAATNVVVSEQVAGTEAAGTDEMVPSAATSDLAPGGEPSDTEPTSADPKGTVSAAAEQAANPRATEVPSATKASATKASATKASTTKASLSTSGSSKSGADAASAAEPLVVEPLPPLALTRDELAESSGCSITMIGDLERYGLVKGRKAGPTVLYDNTALLIARISAQFATFGLEPRHLRTFLIGAEREVGLVHQVVEPMLHRRDEETRRKAHETLEDLTDLAGSLRSILMRQALDELLPKH